MASLNQQTNKLLIFLPKIVTKSNFLYLHGEIETRDHDKCKVYFITEISEVKSEKNCIGIWTKNDHPQKPDYLNLFQKSDKKIVINNEEGTKKSNIIIFYDKLSNGSEINEKSDDLFAMLEQKLKQNKQKSVEKFRSFKFLAVLPYFTVLMPILKFSSTAMQLKMTFQRFQWAISGKKVKVGNFLASVLLDIFLGLCCLHFLLNWTSSDQFPELFLRFSELCVNGLRNLLQWLAGSPAGFKLNKQFNNILAQFFIFYTDIWWIFLVLISPALGIVFNVFIFLGQFGLTLQAAILSDILALISFHAYCIYAFAARLYYIQLSGLTSLWRLFLGRKWNPMRNKVDSCQYSAEQLFVGTLIFTILLFLLPTSLIYYVVFATMRLFIVMIGGILTRIRTILHALPIYTTFLWIFCASIISTQIHMEINTQFCESLVFNVKCVPDSYYITLKHNLPDFVQIEPIEAGKIIQTLLTGQLLCPV